ncbi:hypothetical protein SAMD00019534_122720, partial [Acytostelium subglobosum LB1]|uniref:hypothetical protein n=1 Tax=Acytostelium subglobosum LB1 TaxID=1410327 RepID=UPI00064490FC
MPCILKVKIVEGRYLPIMDRSSALADAFVEVRCGNQNDPQKTDIKRKTLNPMWNHDFRFEFPNEADLQDKPLDIRVWDYDLVSKNDMIGTVLIDLNCLFSGENGQISGWFPIFDTLRGIRGELFVVAKLEMLQNANPFKDASAGVQFFSSSTPFSNYRISCIHQFVEELIVESDPEYHWTDTFRASRLSNFERQTLLYTLSGKLRRQMGKKILDIGGNAVLGYKQHFDLEGDSGIVARGYGTAVTLRKITEMDLVSPILSPKTLVSQSDNFNGPPTYSFSSSSDSDDYSTSSSSSSSRSSDERNSSDNDKPSIDFISDVQLLTLNDFQSHLVVYIGGIVATKSVKILKKSNSQEKRDGFWNEIRNEIKTHARSLGCNYIVGYTETTTIQQSEDLCIFSATGTAVILDFSVSPQQHSGHPHHHNNNNNNMLRKMSKIEDSSEDLSSSYKKLAIQPSSVDKQGLLAAGSTGAQKRKPVTRSGSMSGSIEDTPDSFTDPHIRRSNIAHSTHGKPRKNISRTGCSICHIPYSREDSPFPGSVVACAVCKKKYVPEVLMATIEVPPGMPITGKGCLVQARVCRLKKKVQGDSNATQLSESVPFIEYDLHNQMMYRLKVLGMNAAFGFKTQITFSDTLIIGVATATAVFLTPLPAPPIIHISRNIEQQGSEDAKNLNEIQHRIEDFCKINHDRLQKASKHHQPDTFERFSTHAQARRGRSPAPFSMHNTSESEAQSHGDESLDSSLEVHDKVGKKSSSANKKHHGGGRHKKISKSTAAAYDTSSEDEDDGNPRAVIRRSKKELASSRAGRANSVYSDSKSDSDHHSLSSSYNNTTEASDGDEMDSSSDQDQYDMSDEEIPLPKKKHQHQPQQQQQPHKKKQHNKGQRKIAVSKASHSSLRRGDRHHKQSTTSPSSSSDEESVLSYPPERISESSSAFVVEVDDKIDEDKMITLLDFYSPPGFSLCNTELLPGQSNNFQNVRLVTAIRRVEWDVDSNYLNNQLSVLFNDLYDSVMFKLRDMAPCILAGVNVDIKIPEDDQLQMLFTAMCIIEGSDNQPNLSPESISHSNSSTLLPPLPSTLPPLMNLAGGNTNKLAQQQSIPAPPSSISTPSSSSSNVPIRSSNASPYLSNPIPFANEIEVHPPHHHGLVHPVTDLQFDMSPPRSPIKKSLEASHPFNLDHRAAHESRNVELTPLSYLPKSRMDRYLGRVNIHLIKESFSVRESGGLGVFSHVFLTEANAIVRAHVVSIGANALVGYHIDEFNLILDSGPKGQAYSLISISGDAYSSS